MTRKIKLSDGKLIPAVGWGNMGGKEKALSAGTAALKAGIRHIDSAQIYRTEAEVIGAISGAELNREDVFVTTKIFNLPQTDATPQDIRACVQRSLRELTFVPDLFLIHNPYIPSKAGVSLGDFWKELESMVDDGMLEGCSLGVSNFRPGLGG